MKIITMFQICKKDMLLMVRDKSALFFTVVFPLLMAIFFGTVFSGGGSSSGISLVISDQDNSLESKAYIETLTKSAALRVTLLDEEIASEKVRKGKISAMLVIPKGFGAARESIFDGVTPEIKLGIDPGKKAAAGMLQGVLMAQAAKDMQSKFTDTSQMMKEVDKSLVLIGNDSGEQSELVGFLGSLKKWMKSEEDKQSTNDSDTKSSATTNTSNGFMPLIINNVDIIKEKKGPQNPYAISFPQGMVWGIIGAISTFSLALITEARDGTLSRLSAAPISRMTILGGKALASFLTITGISSLLMTVGIVIFNISIHSWTVLIVSILSAAIGFSGLMMFLAVLGKTEKAASGISWAVMIVMAMTGGGMIPLMLMPKWMGAVGDFSPIKWAVVSFEGSLWRQYTLVDLLPSTLLLLTLGVVAFTLGSYIFNRREIR
ncbi:MAG: ABC transporter permease [Gammaproteobacteria bacterium]|nr:ABC transporter permease [Gammaproteobacteria bacterium]